MYRRVDISPAVFASYRCAFGDTLDKNVRFSVSVVTALVVRYFFVQDQYARCKKSYSNFIRTVAFLFRVCYNRGK